MSKRDLIKLGEGREAEIFAWDDHSVLRLMRNAAFGERLEKEAAALRVARDGGLPVPSPGELIQLDGRPGLVMQRIDGPDLITAVGRKPWLIVRYARTLGRLHVQMHRIEAPTLASTKVVLAERIGMAKLPARTAEAALRMLEGLPDGRKLCHGDFHPGNILVDDRGPFVIDWANSSRGDPDSDVARTLLLLELAVIPDTFPWLVRTMTMTGRRFFLSGYLRAYRKARPFDPSTSERWKIVQAAARCAEGIAEETPLLVAYIEQRIDR